MNLCCDHQSFNTYKHSINSSQTDICSCHASPHSHTSNNKLPKPGSPQTISPKYNSCGWIQSVFVNGSGFMEWQSLGIHDHDNEMNVSSCITPWRDTTLMLKLVPFFAFYLLLNRIKLKVTKGYTQKKLSATFYCVQKISQKKKNPYLIPF